MGPFLTVSLRKQLILQNTCAKALEKDSDQNLDASATWRLMGLSNQLHVTGFETLSSASPVGGTIRRASHPVAWASEYRYIFVYGSFQKSGVPNMVIYEHICHATKHRG